MEWFMAFGLGLSIGGLVGVEIYRRIKSKSYAHLWKQLEEYYNVKAELDMVTIEVEQLRQALAERDNYIIETHKAKLLP